MKKNLSHIYFEKKVTYLRHLKNPFARYMIQIRVDSSRKLSDQWSVQQRLELLSVPPALLSVQQRLELSVQLRLELLSVPPVLLSVQQRLELLSVAPALLSVQQRLELLFVQQRPEM